MTAKKYFPSLLYPDMTEEQLQEIALLDIDALMAPHRLRRAFGNAIFPNANDKVLEQQHNDVFERKEDTGLLNKGWK